VPIHFNYAGVADRWGSKWVYAIFGLIPLFEMAAYGVYRHVARKRGKARPNEALESRIVPLIGLFLAALSWFLLLQIRSGQGALEPSTFCWILTGVGTLMMCVSNSMAKIRPNRTFGSGCPGRSRMRPSGTGRTASPDMPAWWAARSSWRGV
jgi:uncharacterized membrane protein (GlpM family)